MGGGGGSKKKRRQSGAGGSKKKRRRSGAPSNKARAEARASHRALQEVTVNGLAVTGLQDEWLLGMGSELVSVPSAAIRGWKVDDRGKSVECRSKEQTRHMLVHMCDAVQTAMGAHASQGVPPPQVPGCVPLPPGASGGNAEVQKMGSGTDVPVQAITPSALALSSALLMSQGLVATTARSVNRFSCFWTRARVSSIHG